MRTDKIDRLLSALGRPAHQAYAEQARAGAQNAQRTSAAEEDAVKIDPSLRGRTGESERGQGQAKVDRIAAQIRTGTYHPKSEEIAVALIKELNIG